MLKLEFENTNLIKDLFTIDRFDKFKLIGIDYKADILLTVENTKDLLWEKYKEILGELIKLNKENIRLSIFLSLPDKFKEALINKYQLKNVKNFNLNIHYDGNLSLITGIDFTEFSMENIEHEKLWDIYVKKMMVSGGYML